MRGAILGHGAVALLSLLAMDRFWPIWPVHAIVVLSAVVVILLAALAIVAAGRR